MTVTNRQSWLCFGGWGSSAEKVSVTLCDRWNFSRSWKGERSEVFLVCYGQKVTTWIKGELFPDSGRRTSVHSRSVLIRVPLGDVSLCLLSLELFSVEKSRNTEDPGLSVSSRLQNRWLDITDFWTLGKLELNLSHWRTSPTTCLWTSLKTFFLHLKTSLGQWGSRSSEHFIF